MYCTVHVCREIRARVCDAPALECTYMSVCVLQIGGLFQSEDAERGKEVIHGEGGAYGRIETETFACMKDQRKHQRCVGVHFVFSAFSRQ